MVKGNWERRAEMANKRREEARARKAARGAIHASGPEAIITRLRKDYNSSRAHLVLCWVSVTVSDSDGDEWESGRKPICTQWFRTEYCENKRCRKSHEITISNEFRVDFDPLKQYEPQAVVIMMPMIELKTKDILSIKFISVDRVCVYDWSDPNVWSSWLTFNAMEIASVKQLNSIPEDTFGDETLSLAVEVINISSVMEESTYSNNSGSICDFISSQSIFSLIFSFASLTDSVLFGSTCKLLRRFCRSDEDLRSRKKEFLSPIAVDARRLKREEKKKKLKTSHMKKASKKDGFARGGK